MDIRNDLSVECPRAKGDYLEQAPSYIWTDPGWVLEPKEDGERDTFQVEADGSLLIGRNRQDFLKGVDKAGSFRCHNSENPYLAAIASKEFAGTLLDGERTEGYKKDGTKNKCTRDREALGWHVGYVVWDCLFLKGVDLRDWPLHLRRKAAREVVQALANPRVVLIAQFPAEKGYMEKLFDDGWEGAVAKNLEHSVPKNQRTHPGYWKLKGDDKRTVDAFVIGVTEATAGGSGLTGIKPRPTGNAASFTMGMLDGKKVVIIGKMGHLPERETRLGLLFFKSEFKGKVAELKVSGWDGHAFRWPRFVKWRDDKGRNDCLVGEQIGGDYGSNIGK